MSFTARSLHPSLVSATSPFSPNGDLRYDTTRVVLRLPDTEGAVYRVVSATGSSVAGPRSLGTLAKGDHAFTWNGKTNAGAALPNGIYTISVSTTALVSGTTLRGTATRAVRLDTVAPMFSSVIGANSIFYPVVDGYLDAFAGGVKVNEPSTLSMRVYNGAGTLVRALAVNASVAGAYRLTWNGRTAAGTLLPAGTYRFAFTAVDRAANARTTGRYGVGLSLKRLVPKSATLVKAGNSAYASGGSLPCAGADASASDYTNGLWLGNACDPYYDGTQSAAALYAFTLPVAFRYTSLRFDTYGYSFYAPSQIVGDAYNFATAQYDSFSAQDASSTECWRTVSRPAVSGHISGRTVETAINVLDDASATADYDIAQVRLVVTYQVLA